MRRILDSFTRPRKLHQRTLELLDRLFENEWFSEVGKPLDSQCYVLGSWGQALDYHYGDGGFYMDVRNDYIGSLRELAPQRDRHWNTIRNLAIVEFEPMVKRRVSELAKLTESDRERMLAIANWSIVHACI